MRNFILIGLFLSIYLTLTPGSTIAQEIPIFQYSVKFICGESPGQVVARGYYFTAINVHNPTEKPIEFRKKFAIALPWEKPGPVTDFFNAKLGPDQALEIDCPDIFELTPPADFKFKKGFAVIESDVELDVVAVYTAAAGRTRPVETLDVERVLPRRRDGVGVHLPDLVPVADMGELCRTDTMGGETVLIVTIRNQGNADAPASITKVEFRGGSSQLLPTPPIQSGGTVTLTPVVIPANCFAPDCHITITVDSPNQINESDEGNNSAGCIIIG